MSAGWGRFQDEGAGPDWLADAGEDDGAGQAQGDGAPGWAAAAEPGAAARPGAAAKPGTRPGGSAVAGPSGSADGAPDGAAEPGAGPSGSADGAPGWAAAAESEAGAVGPSGWAALADGAAGRGGGGASTSGRSERGGAARAGQQRGASRGFGEGRRGGSAASKNAAAKKTAGKNGSSGWSSRRKDRDPAEADKPKPPPSREKLEQRAKNILMYHLGRQMQTRSQLATKLRKKEIPDDIAETVLDRFEELHLLNDATYAETFVRSRHSERGLAKRALGYELRKRGVDEETAAEALSAVDEDQEAATARRLVDSRLRATRGLDPQVRTRRLVGMLARKGYSSSVAFRAVKEALAEEGQDVEFEDPGFD